MTAKTDQKTDPKIDMGLNRAFSVFGNTPTTPANLNSLQGAGVAEQGWQEFGRGRLDRRQRSFE